MSNLSEQSPGLVQILSRYSVFVGLILIVFTILYSILDIDKETATGAVSLTIMFILCLWVVYDVRKNNGGFLSFKDGFKSGFIAMTGGGILNLIYYYLHITVIDEHFIDEMMQQRLDEMKQKGLAEETMQQSLAFIEKMNSPEIIILLGSVNVLVSSLFFALVAGAIFNKRNES